VKLPSGVVVIKIWNIDVGRVKLYLLDTNIPENERAEDREITAQLYGGDNLTRIRQEIVLGIGGLRALDRLNLKPTVWHMNEGHSAFLAIERMRRFIKEYKLTFEEAFEACRSNSVFTTHTSGAGRHRSFRSRIAVRIFQRVLQEAAFRSRSSWRWAASVPRIITNRFRWRSRPFRPPRSATR
jgi:starch phosphorylase